MQQTEMPEDAVVPGPQPPPEPAAASGWLSYQARPVRGRLAAATGAGLVAGWLAFAQAGLIAAIVHALLVDHAQREALLVPFGLWLLSIPLRSAAMAARDQFALSAALAVRTGLRARLAAHLVDLGPVGVARIGQGQASSVLLDQVDALEGYYARYLPQLVLALAIPLSMLLVVFWLDWLAGTLLLLATPLIPLFMALVGMGAAAVHRGQFQALERLSGYFLDRLQGLDTLRHLGRAEDTHKTLDYNAEAYRRSTMSVLRVAFLSSAVLEFFSSVAIAMVAVYVGLGLLGYFTLGPAGELTLFSGLFVLLLAPEVFAPLRDLAQHYHDRAAALGAAAGIRTLLETPSPAAPRTGDEHPEATPPALRVDHVTVQHDTDGPAVFQDLSLAIPAGRTTLVTGESGSGKTTLLMLLMGMLDVRTGAVLVNGKPLTSHAPGSLEHYTGWLGQTPRLLPGTLRENIQMGRPDAPSSAVRQAAGDAGVLRFSDSLPEGLDTPVEQRGGGISGGEAQRVALARALLRDPAVLILDEPTASLDPESRDIVLEVLRGLHGQRTIVIASHQPDRFPWVDNHIHLESTTTKDAEENREAW